MSNDVEQRRLVKVRTTGFAIYMVPLDETSPIKRVEQHKKGAVEKQHPLKGTFIA